MKMFNTFFMGGFECADHINRSGERINLLKETQHDIRAEEDYRLLLEIGIGTVREGVCWSDVETAPYVFDFSEVKNRMEIAEKLGIQQIWDLCHFGYPDNIYPTHPHFCHRFEALCEAFANFFKANSTSKLFVVPINEISFLSWHSGDVRGTVPFAVHCGFDIKYHLCKAAILGIERLRSVIPDCRIILVEPMIKVHARDDSDPQHIVNINDDQFQAMDIIAGRMCPELGGQESNLDILGLNYYWDCQWEHCGSALDWPETSQKRTSLPQLLKTVYTRYNKPIFLSETGHFGSGREQWMEEITAACIEAIAMGVDLNGACIYPVIDRPDWDNLSIYHNSGIFDLDADKNRVAYRDYSARLRQCVENADRALNGGFLESVAKLPHRVAAFFAEF